jgi:Domain of unknown function (DUF4345)
LTVISTPWLVLLFAGVGFLGFGLAYSLRPVQMAAFTDLALATATARADFAATYGGFQIGFGLFLLACAHHRGWLEPGLWAATAALLGLASVRALGILWSRGQVRGTIWFGLGLELVGLALNVWALAQVS